MRKLLARTGVIISLLPVCCTRAVAVTGEYIRPGWPDGYIPDGAKDDSFLYLVLGFVLLVIIIAAVVIIIRLIRKKRK